MRDLNDAEAFEFYRGLLAYLAATLQPASYLEIGLGSGATFHRMVPHCGRLRGVDPNVPAIGGLPDKCELFRLRSDDYFAQFPSETYDLVWVDGHHEHQQVLRDIRNALACIAPGGIVLAHDLFPPTLAHTDAMNCGDAYKAAIELRQDPDLEVYTIPVRFGVTFIGKVGTVFPWVHA